VRAAAARRRIGLAAGAAVIVATASCAGSRGPTAGGMRAAPGGRPAPAVIVDDFEDAAAWSAHPADGVELELGADAGAVGRALRLDVRFVTGGGYAVARRDVDLDLPENYALSFRVRGDVPPNHLELKLIDDTGENVWWHVWRDVDFPAEWKTFRVKKRQIRFAWGPLGGGDIRHVAAIEWAVTAGSGGEGSVWIDELTLTLTPLPPPGAPLPPPVASASSFALGRAPETVLDDDPESFWQAAEDDAAPWIALDFGGEREYGGLIVDWMPGRGAADYVVETSGGDGTWRQAWTVTGGKGGRDHLYLPESESRQVRIRILGAGGRAAPAIAAVRAQPLEWAATRETFFRAIADDAPRGSHPRGIRGEESFWTVVGADADPDDGLLGQDGALELRAGGCTLEPFLLMGKRLVTWADATAEPSLEDGYLPIPSVRWDTEPELTVTAFAAGPPGRSSLVGRYRVRNRGPQAVDVTLVLAVRPFQVNPPSQALNLAGGTSRIDRLVFRDGALQVNDGPPLLCAARPAGFGAVTFAGGDVVSDFLRRGVLPPAAEVRDSFGAASGALSWPLRLEPGGEREVFVIAPFGWDSVKPAAGEDAAAWARARWEETVQGWRSRLQAPDIRLPESAAPALLSMRAQLGYILVNRAGPAIQPGARSYARSWIRDGALTSSALLRAGYPDAAREFLEWYAPHQFESGKVPCVVDRRGADPVPEHDSSGELIFLTAEYLRYTGDRELPRKLWPRVAAAAAYLDSLRQERRTAEWRTPENAPFFGILPPSISHEGYSAKPMHSYWDDFFAWRGFRDAAWLAGELEMPEEAARIGAIRDEFGGDFAASIVAAMAHHGVDYVPGCADLGDFDATSTTIALSPVQAEALLPAGAAERTFGRYWEFFRERRDGAPWDAFTPYEIRNVGAMVRLGQRERAWEAAEWFLGQQRPPGWRQWPEVVFREPEPVRFLGDLPHTWVGSDYVRSFLDLLAYVREADQALVIGAGVPAQWMEPPGVEVRGLVTPHGPLTFSMLRGEYGVTVRVGGDVRVPPGGIVVRRPLESAAGGVTVDGRPAEPDAEGAIVVRRVPAVVVYGVSRTL
jgi:hypothetical protein